MSLDVRKRVKLEVIALKRVLGETLTEEELKLWEKHSKSP